jgi:PAS domain S-box-containing protein
MGQDAGKRFLEYAVALLAAATAVLVRWLIDPWFGDFGPLVTLYGAMVLAVWFGGYRPALLAMVVGYLACDYLFIEPRGVIGHNSARDLIRLLIYAISCSAIISFVEAMRLVRRRLAGANARHQESEAAFQAAMRQLQIVTESMAAPVVRCSRDLRYLWVNKPYADLIGRPPEETVGRAIIDILGQEAFDQLRPRFEQVLRGEKVQYEEEVNARGRGRRWVHAIYTPTFDRLGEPDGWVAVVLDVTRRRQVEEALRDSEQRFRQLAESINEVFWMSNPQTTEILYISPAYELIWGRSCQSLHQQPRSFLDAVHPEDRERVRVAALEKHSRGESTDEEYRVVRPDGSVRWVRDQAFPVRDAAGRIYRMVGIAEDITERKSAEAALQEANRRKDEFLATLAHELRNPLAPIRNAVQVLRMSEALDPQLGNARDIIDRQVQQMVRLIDDLLDISRITRGKLQLRKERVELAAVVQSAVEAARPLIDVQAHELDLTLPQERVTLDADSIRLAQVFSNLLNNAAKYTEKGGHLWLTAERLGSEVAVSVRDTGIGIAAEHLPHVFGMFSQVAPALERSQGGLGIGLALVQGLVRLHGGSVEARSPGPGRGSEFIVRLPVMEAPVAAASEQPHDQGARSLAGPKCRVLVADDLRDTVDSLAMLLRIAGHEIRTAHDGLEAMQEAATFRPDVVLLDIGMPKMNGYEAARSIRKEPWGKDMLLIALTGWGQEEDKRRATEAGFDYHLTKPVSPDTLHELLAGRGQTGSRG